MKMLKLLKVFLAIIVVASFGCDGRQEEVNYKEKDGPPAHQGKIVALGDSLTAGLGVELEQSYPSLLQAKLTADGYSFRVINAGVSGETSSGTLSRIDWILSQNPDIVILEIGANDGLRGIDTQLIEKNIRNILQRIQDRDIIVVLAGMKMVWNLGPQYTGRFNSLYPKLAEEFGVIFMPFFLESVAAVPSLNSADGIHPNSQGYQLITENIYPYVLQAIAEVNKDSSL